MASNEKLLKPNVILKYSLNTVVVSTIIGISLAAFEFLSDIVLPSSLNQVSLLVAVIFASSKFAKAEKRKMMNSERVIYASGVTVGSFLVGSIVFGAIFIYYDIPIGVEGLNLLLGAKASGAPDLSIYLVIGVLVTILLWLLSYCFVWIMTSQMAKKLKT